MKEYKPDFSHIKNKLTSQSWLWFHSRLKELKLNSRLIVFEKIEEIQIDDVLGEISFIAEKIEEWKKYSQKFDKILIEQVRFHQGCGDYKDVWYLVGERFETEVEMKVRIDSYNKKIEEDEKAAIDELKTKKDKEYQKFLKLKNKFEPKTVIERTQELNKKIREMGASSEFEKKGDDND